MSAFATYISLRRLLTTLVWMENSRSVETHLAMQMSRRKVARMWAAGSSCRCPVCPRADLLEADPPHVGLCCWSGIRASSSRRCSSCLGPLASASATLRASGMSTLGRCGSMHVVDGSAYQEDHGDIRTTARILKAQNNLQLPFLMARCVDMIHWCSPLKSFAKLPMR